MESKKGERQLLSYLERKKKCRSDLQRNEEKDEIEKILANQHITEDERLTILIGKIKKRRNAFSSMLMSEEYFAAVPHLRLLNDLKKMRLI